MAEEGQGGGAAATRLSPPCPAGRRGEDGGGGRARRVPGRRAARGLGAERRAVSPTLADGPLRRLQRVRERQSNFA